MTGELAWMFGKTSLKVAAEKALDISSNLVLHKIATLQPSDCHDWPVRECGGGCCMACEKRDWTSSWFLKRCCLQSFALFSWTL